MFLSPFQQLFQWLMLNQVADVTSNKLLEYATMNSFFFADWTMPNEMP